MFIPLMKESYGVGEPNGLSAPQCEACRVPQIPGFEPRQLAANGPNHTGLGGPPLGAARASAGADLPAWQRDPIGDNPEGTGPWVGLCWPYLGMLSETALALTVRNRPCKCQS